MILGLPDLVFGLIVGIVAGGILELSILWFAGRRWIPNRSAEVYNAKAAAGDLDDARDHFIEPIREEIQALKADLTPNSSLSQEFEDFEARFTSAYTQDIQTLQTDIMTEMEKIPLRVSGIIHGTAGAEEKAFRAMVVDAEAEVEGEITVMEAVAAQDPRAMQVAIAQKIQKLGNDPEWQKEHQIGSLILEMGKPTLMNWVQTMTAQMQGVPSARLSSGGSSTKIYGT
ncbi:MAG: hypothetical protein V3U33_00355 [candidate division NC10 bacterium]